MKEGGLRGLCASLMHYGDSNSLPLALRHVHCAITFSLRRLRVALLAAVVAAVAATPTIPVQAKAMYNPELFQGDIKGIAGQEPGVSKDRRRGWCW